MMGVCYCCRTVTKPETDFADDDLRMACCGAWLLTGHAPGRERPPLDLDLGALDRFVGKHGGLTPLAHFATIRFQDAIRGGRQMPDAALRQAADPPMSQPLLRNAARAEACRHEKRASDQLREGELRVANALKEWLAASEARADDYTGASAQFLTGEHHAVLGELLAIAERLERVRLVLENSLRYVDADEEEADPFPSVFGLPRAARNLALDDQALCLLHGGSSLEEIAYVMGWYYGDVAQIEKRTAKRLKEAEERRRGEPAPSDAPDVAWNVPGFP